MKEKRKKGESTSSETPEKKRASGGRLSGMLESMEKRGSPVNAHKVATAYFESFRKDRNIPDEPGEEPHEDETAAVDTGVESVETTAVSSAVKKTSGEKKTPRASARAAARDGDPLLTISEQKVYESIYKVSEGSGVEGVRVGLKELRELAGLSDKTVRLAVHSLREKLNIEVLEQSLGVYGRKYRVYGLEEVHRRRLESGLVVDPVTKKVLAGGKMGDTAVGRPVSNAVSTAVNTTVITAVATAVIELEAGIADMEAVFERYTGEKPGDEVRAFCERNAGTDAGVIEAAVILTTLKGKGRAESLAGFIEDVELELARLGAPLPAGYLEGLRGVWESLRKKA